MVQYLKSRSTITMLVTMFLVSAICMVSLFMSAGSITEDITPENGLSRVLLTNNTSLDIKPEDIASSYPSPLDVSYEGDTFMEDEALVTISSADGQNFDIKISLSSDSIVTDYEVSRLTSAIDSAVTLARYRASGITDEQLSVALSHIYISDGDISDYLNTQSSSSTDELLDIDNGAFFILSYAYSIIVLILVMFSTSFIIQSIVEEKASKLVELLMVSVKPLALILGKILATMVFMAAALLALGAGMGLTTAVMSNFVDTSSVTSTLASSGIDLTLSLRLILTLPAVLISVVLGYLTFSLIGGVLGACCSKLEDIGAATGGVTFITLICYLLTTVGSTAGSRGFVIFCSLCPFVSVFSAPVAYLTGIIGFGMLCLSWLLQAVVIILVTMFCARVYGTLIIHRGNRIKLKALFAIARGKE